jgi:membrane protein implicated in regulation of membrane protease activity
MEFLVYVICLGVGLLFTLLSFLFGHHFGGSHEPHVDGSGGHAEAGPDSSDMPGVSALSPSIISAFVTAFGGFGIIFTRIHATDNVFISAPLAIVCALVTSGLLLWVLRLIFKETQSSSESRVSRVVGTVANVITPIPEQGVGEIAYVVAGSRYTAPAREESGQPVANGRAVKVTRVVGTQFYVTVT